MRNQVYVTLGARKISTDELLPDGSLFITRTSKMTSMTLHDVAQRLQRTAAEDVILKFLEHFDTGNVEEMVTLLDYGAVMDPCNTMIYGDCFTTRLQGVEDIRATLREVVARYKTDHIVTNLQIEVSGCDDGMHANVRGKFQVKSWTLQSEDVAELDSRAAYSAAGGDVRFKLVNRRGLGWQIHYFHVVTLYSNLVQSNKFTMEFLIS